MQFCRSLPILILWRQGIDGAARHTQILNLIECILSSYCSPRIASRPFCHVWQFSTVNICFRSREFIVEKKSYWSVHMALLQWFVLFLKFTQTHFSSFSSHFTLFFSLIYYNPCLMGVLWFLLCTREPFWALWALRVMKRSSSSSTGQP